MLQKHLNLTILLLVFISVCLVCAALYGCSHDGDVTPDTVGTRAANETGDDIRFVEAESGNVVEVRSMDDPDNPFKDEYQAWDMWFYDHLLTEIPDYVPWSELTEEEAEERRYRTTKESNWLSLMARLDEDGYIIPDTLCRRDWEQSKVDGSGNLMLKQFEWVRADGEIPRTTRVQMNMAADAVSATYYPTIPEWLYENPPKCAMLLPNGDVITQGLLGSAEEAASGSGCRGGQSSFYAKYDRSGNTLRAAKLDSWWFLQYDLDINDRPEGVMVTTLDGYVKFYEDGETQLLSVWDWDGTQLATVEPPRRDPHPFTWVNSTRIKNLYEAAHQ